MLSDDAEIEVLRMRTKQLRRLKRKLFLEAIRDQESWVGRFQNSAQNFFQQNEKSSENMASSSLSQRSLTLD
jgi:hypothetical protein